jgi:hypothetical protein
MIAAIITGVLSFMAGAIFTLYVTSNMNRDMIKTINDLITANGLIGRIKEK